MEIALVAVSAALCIAVVTAYASRLGVAAPLVLVAVGVVATLLPGVPEVDIDPEWVLIGVLPPLLYSASVSMPAMDFRRDFRAIGGLSVVLVVISAVAVGGFLAAAVPGITLSTGIALGAIISPTDAVATSIVKRLGVSPRVVTVLEGESLLNDATALVLLRSAVAATATSISIWGVAWDFVTAVVIAVVIGLVVGRLNLVVRAKVSDSAVNTAISFTVPFVAYLPAEHLGASGLVAAVAAGLHTGQYAPRFLTPRHRLSEEQNWRTVELLLEGGVFLLMGLELEKVVSDVRDVDGDLWSAIWIGAVAAALVVLIRAAYVAPLMIGLRRRADRGVANREQLTAMQTKLDDGTLPMLTPRREPRNEREAARVEQHTERHTERLGTRIRRTLADVDYLAGAPLGWREGTVLVWAGMRGVVTLAAAQTLDPETPQRSLLVLIAFVVAAGTLVVQGGSLPWLVARLGLSGQQDPDADDAERGELLTELNAAARTALQDPDLRRPDGTPYDPAILERARAATTLRTEDDDEAGYSRELGAQFRELRLLMITAMRESLLDARSDGTYASETLENALTVLDAEQITAELRG